MLRHAQTNNLELDIVHGLENKSKKEHRNYNDLTLFPLQKAKRHDIPPS